jgi:DNA modification methylase
MINTIIQGDCLEKLKELEDNSVDVRTFFDENPEN